MFTPSPSIDLAEYVLNKCITEDEHEWLMPQQRVVIDGEDDVDGPTVTARKSVQSKSVQYNFDFLESSYLEDSEKRSPLKHRYNHTDEPDCKQQIPHIDEQDFKGKTTATVDQLDSDEQISYEHHDKCIDEHELRRRICTDGEDYVDSLTVSTDKPRHHNFDDQEDKDRQILHNDHSNHILDWMVSYDIVRVG